MRRNQLAAAGFENRRRGPYTKMQLPIIAGKGTQFTGNKKWRPRVLQQEELNFANKLNEQKRNSLTS